MSKIFVISIIVIVLLVFAIGGIFLWQQSQLTLAPAQPTVQQTLPPPAPAGEPAPSPQPQNEVLDTSDWQIYRYQLGFEVKYPQDWQATANLITNTSTGSSFGVIKNKNPDNLTLDEWFRQATLIQGRPTVKAAAVPVLINGVKAYRLNSNYPPPGSYFEVVAIADSQGSIFSIYGNYNVQKDATTLDQILSTFRFLIPQSLDDALSFLSSCGSEAKVSIEAADFDTDAQKEYFVQCSSGVYPFKSTRLYILDDGSAQWKILWSRALSVGEPFILRFTSSPILVDIDVDGIEEVSWTGEVRGGTCVGGVDYKILYSSKYKEFFYTFQNQYYEFNEQGDCTNLLAEPLEFSSNLEKEEYAIFKEYLRNKE